MPVAALVLSVCALLVFAAREAGAHTPAPEERGAVSAGAERMLVVESRSPGSAGGPEPVDPGPPAETPGPGAEPGPAEPTTPDPASPPGQSDGQEPRAPEEPASRPAPEGVPAEPAPESAVVAPAASTSEEPEPPAGAEPALFEDLALEAGAPVGTERPGLDPATPGPASSAGSGPSSPAPAPPAEPAEEAPVPLAVLPVSGYEEPEPISRLEPGGASNAAPGSSGDVPAIDTLENLVGGSLLWLAASEGGNVVGAMAEDVYSGVETGLALVASVGAPEPAPTSPREGASPEGAPLPPVLPPLSPGDDSFSLSGSGELLGVGCAGPLLLCILVLAALPAARRTGKLSRIFCNFMKPTSALLLPLERPG